MIYIRNKRGVTLVEVLMACVAFAVLMVPVFMLMNMGTQRTIMNKQEILVHAYASNILNFIISQGKEHWQNRPINFDGKNPLDEPLISIVENVKLLNSDGNLSLDFKKPEGVKFIDDKCGCYINTFYECDKYIYRLVSVEATWEVSSGKENSIKLSGLLYEEKD